MLKLIPVVFLFISSPLRAADSGGWGDLYSKTSEKFIVTVKQIAPTTYMDPKAKLSIEIKRRTDTRVIGTTDITPKGYSATILGKPDIDFFSDINGNSVLIFQCVYGGDGSHSPNLLRIFSIKEKSIVLLREEYIEKPKYQAPKGVIQRISGYHVESLCDYCDGFSGGGPEDLDTFWIPIEIDMAKAKPTRRSTLTQNERTKLLQKLEAGIAKRLKDQDGEPQRIKQRGDEIRKIIREL